MIILSINTVRNQFLKYNLKIVIDEKCNALKSEKVFTEITFCVKFLLPSIWYEMEISSPASSTLFQCHDTKLGIPVNGLQQKARTRQYDEYTALLLANHSHNCHSLWVIMTYKESAQIWEIYSEDVRHNCKYSAQETAYYLVSISSERNRKHKNETFCSLR